MNDRNTPPENKTAPRPSLAGRPPAKASGHADPSFAGQNRRRSRGPAAMPGCLFEAHPDDSTTAYLCRRQ